MRLSSNHELFVHSAAAIALLAAGSASLRAAEPTTEQLLQRIDALENRVQTLQQNEQDRTKDAQSAAVRELQSDADAHSVIRGPSDFNISYHDGQLLIRSEDNRFLFHPWLQFQFREATTFRDDGKDKGTQDDTQAGFEVRRLKLGLDGHAFSPDLTYMFQLNLDRTDGDILLELAWAKYHFKGTPFSIRGGQFKDPFDHEQLSATRNLPVSERSLVNDTFAAAEGFVKGVSIVYDPATFIRAEAAITNGLGNYNTNFQQTPTTRTIPINWVAAARAEYKVFGNWKDYDVVTAYNAKENTLVFGGGIDYLEAGHTDTLTHVVDAQFTDSHGLSLYGAYLGRYNARGTHGDTYDATLRGQVSYAIDRHWEPYARYEYIHFDSAEFAAGTNANVHVLTAGFNYYLYGPSARFSVDLSYLPNGTPVADTGADILINGKNEFVLRGQFQLVL